MRRIASCAVAVAALLALYACTGEDPTPPPETTTTSEGTETPTETPTPTPTPPVLPPEAAVGDDLGAAAFVRHWFDLVNYAYATADTAPMLAVASELCIECVEYEDRILDLTANGDRITTPAIEVISALGGIPDNIGRAPVEIAYRQPDMTIIGADGSEEQLPAGEEQAAVVYADFKEGAWTMIGIGLPPS